MFTPKRDTMRRSSKPVLFALLLSIGSWAQQAPNQASDQGNAQATTANATQSGGLLPVQDLAPPPDSEAERMNAEAARANARPANQPANQPSDTVTVGGRQEPKKQGDQYIF